VNCTAALELDARVRTEASAARIAPYRTSPRALVVAARALGGIDVLINNASILGPSPQPRLMDYPLDVLERVYRTNVVAPLGLIQVAQHDLKPGARIINVSSDAGVQPYAGWGGYGSSKAALEQLSSILAAENPTFRVYWIDPGDMRTQLHQEAFPNDISDRPMPETSVPGFIGIDRRRLPSGRYEARVLSRSLRLTEELHRRRRRSSLTAV
jgi:NAD(P)-dependent dehydrogenase (short-subunit alcohol dehydrogenase family)